MNWINAKDEKPNKRVIASVLKSSGKRYIAVVEYFGKFEHEANGDDEIAEYCEEKDEYFVPEGWYEVVHNWDYTSVFISDEVTHWHHPIQHPE